MLLIKYLLLKRFPSREYEVRASVIAPVTTEGLMNSQVSVKETKERLDTVCRRIVQSSRIENAALSRKHSLQLE